MPYPKPLFDELPTNDGKSQKYKAAGKLKGKSAIITGGDSGIGRATAILFAMEGADSLIAYLPEEEEDAQETKRRVEEYGQRCHLLATDLTDRANCQKVIDEAVKLFNGKLDILFNNAGYQNMIEEIKDLPEYVPSPKHPITTTTISHSTYLLTTPTEPNGSTHSTQTSTPSSTSPNTPSPTWHPAAPSSTTPA